MTAEPSSNSFRAALLSGRSGTRDDLLLRAKNGHLDPESEGLAGVQIPRAECRRGNQRGGDRHRLSAEQAIVIHPTGEEIVEVVNLSAGGAMISTRLKLTLWDHVGLVLGGEDVIDCAVRWIKGRRVGLEFAPETRIDCDSDTRDELLRGVIRKTFPDLTKDPLHYPQRRADDDPDVTPEEAQRRGADRHPMIWNGIIYHDGQVEPVRLRNISVTGALVQSSHALPQDATVYLDLGGAGKVEAVVRWTRGGQSGLSFAEPFDIHRLAAKAPEVAQAEPETPAASNAQPGGWNRMTVNDLARYLGG
jgi:hypothetical protein